MADYYPLLERAVTSLSASTREGRQALYDRARNALLTQMRNVTPTPSQEDIDREEKALDDAIARLEDKLAQEPVAATPAAAAPAADSHPVPPKPQAEPTKLEAGAAETPPPVEVAPTPATEEPTPRPLPRMGGARPQAPGLSGKVELKTQLAPVPGAAGSFFARFRGRSGDTVPAPTLTAAEQPTAADAKTATPRAKLPDLPPRPEPAPAPAPEEDAPAPADEVSFADTETDAADERREQLRPAAPVAKSEPRNAARIAIFGAVIIATIGAIATLAFKWRDNPEDYVRASRPAPLQDNDSNASRKIADRVGGTSQSQQDATRAGTTDAKPATQRAVMLIEAPEDPQRVKAIVGSANWRFDTSSTPGALVVEMDLLNLGTASLRMLRNTDSRIPASYMLEIRFRLKPDSEAPGIKAIDIVQMRADDRQTGDPLAGQQTPVTENFYLVGLTNVEPMSARNLDLLKSRGWIDIPILLNNGRLAKLTIEKGAYGERLLAQALQSWQ
jgi:hypothetical protein